MILAPPLLPFPDKANLVFLAPPVPLIISPIDGLIIRSFFQPKRLVGSFTSTIHYDNTQ